MVKRLYWIDMLFYVWFVLAIFSSSLSAQTLSKSRHATYVFVEHGQEGLLDEEGTILVPARYKMILPLREGLMPAVENDYFVFILRSGRILEGKFYDIKNFKEGLAAVIPYKGGKWGYINLEAHFVITPRFEKALSFAEGLAAVRENGKWGYINKFGKYVIAPDYDEAWDFSNDCATVVKDEVHLSINHTGHILEHLCGEKTLEDKKSVDQDIHSISSPLIPYSGARVFLHWNGNFALANTEGKPLTAPIFEEIDTKNAFTIGDEFPAPVKYKGKWGFINNKGKTVVPFEYDDYCPFVDGVAKVLKRDRGFFINSQGQIIFEMNTSYRISSKDEACSGVDCFNIRHVEYQKDPCTRGKEDFLHGNWANRNMLFPEEKKDERLLPKTK